MPGKPGIRAIELSKKCQPNSHTGRLEIAHLVSEAPDSPRPDSVQRLNDFNCDCFFSSEIYHIIMFAKCHLNAIYVIKVSELFYIFALLFNKYEYYDAVESVEGGFGGAE